MAAASVPYAMAQRERERAVMDELQQLRLHVRTIKSRKDAAVVAVAGECDLHEAQLLAPAIQDAGAAAVTRVYVDLSELMFIDSTALHVLVKAQRSLEAAGSQL